VYVFPLGSATHDFDRVGWDQLCVSVHDNFRGSRALDVCVSSVCAPAWPGQHLIAHVHAPGPKTNRFLDSCVREMCERETNQAMKGVTCNATRFISCSREHGWKIERFFCYARKRFFSTPPFFLRQSSGLAAPIWVALGRFASIPG